MPVTITVPPPAIACAADPLYITLATDTPIASPASVAISVTGSGPASGNSLRLQWLGNNLLFTFTASGSPSATDLPLPSVGETLTAYADRLAERFAQNEVIHRYFRIVRSAAGAAQVVTLEQRALETVDITATATLTNATVTVTDVGDVTQSPNLRAIVEVWQDTGVLATDKRLISLYSPYRLPSGLTEIDIHAAFSGLQPHLPDSGSINPAIFISLLRGEASSALLRYYLRVADKGGSPAAASDLLRSTTSYTAIYGARAGRSAHTLASGLRHAYRRRDGAAFEHPTTTDAPNYLYWLCPDSVTSNVYIEVGITWSDGALSSFNPFGTTTGVAVTPGRLYWIGSGFRQLKINAQTPPAGAAPDAYPVAYTASIRRADGTPLIGEHSATYRLYIAPDWRVPYLLYDNGVGGMEVVAMRGKPVVTQTSVAEQYQRPRAPGWSAAIGEFDTVQALARTAWQVNTGHFSDPYYIEHLQQLPVSKCWLVDAVRRQFLRVIVEPGEMEVFRGDETVYSQSFTVRAGWQDQAVQV